MLNHFILAYLQIFICLVLFLLFTAWYRWFRWQPVRYSCTLSGFLMHTLGLPQRHSSEYLRFILRFIALFLIIFGLARPQVIDPKSFVKTEGVDIILVLDMSYSMLLFDDLHDQRSRIEIAKQEAVNFVERREDDPIGLVLFGRHATSRCPLTLDKNVLKSMIKQLEIGEIDPAGTVLSVAVLTGINRLKSSEARSKVIIILTDGQPSPGDIDPNVAIEIAKKLGIKVYAIGIGSPEGGFFKEPSGMIIQSGEQFDWRVLQQFANQTGARFFVAKDARDLNQIYHIIDELEKTSHETTIFTKRFELFGWFLFLALVILTIELVLTCLVWRGVQ